MTEEAQMAAYKPAVVPEYQEAVERLTATLRDAIAGHHDSILWWYDDLTPAEVNRVTASDARSIIEAVLRDYR